MKLEGEMCGDGYVWSYRCVERDVERERCVDIEICVERNVERER